MHDAVRPGPTHDKRGRQGRARCGFAGARGTHTGTPALARCEPKSTVSCGRRARAEGTYTQRDVRNVHKCSKFRNRLVKRDKKSNVSPCSLQSPSLLALSATSDERPSTRCRARRPSLSLHMHMQGRSCHSTTLTRVSALGLRAPQHLGEHVLLALAVIGGGVVVELVPHLHVLQQVRGAV